MADLETLVRHSATFAFAFLIVFLSTPSPAFGDVYYNSTLACTRGATTTAHDIYCKNTEPKGLAMIISRVFYGATPLSSGCSRTAPYANCCERDPSKEDCVVVSDRHLKDIVGTCSGSFSCQPTARGLSLTNEQCSQTVYPDLTSFSFVEFRCVRLDELKDVCSNGTWEGKGGMLLDSNVIIKNTDVEDDSCTCLVTTECNTTLTVTALDLRLKDANATHCVEELYLRDVVHSDIQSNFTCMDEEVIVNRQLLTSLSHAVRLTLDIMGKHKGRVLLHVQPSVNTAKVKVSCGSTAAQALSELQDCSPAESATITSSHAETVQTTTLASGGGVNSSTDEDDEAGNGDDDGVSNSQRGGVDAISIGTLAGIILAIIAIVVVTCLIIVLIVLHRRRKHGSEDGSSSHVSYDNESGSVGGISMGSRGGFTDPSRFHGAFDPPTAGSQNVYDVANNTGEVEIYEHDYSAPFPGKSLVYDNYINKSSRAEDDMYSSPMYFTNQNYCGHENVESVDGHETSETESK